MAVQVQRIFRDTTHHNTCQAFEAGVTYMLHISSHTFRAQELMRGHMIATHRIRAHGSKRMIMKEMMLHKKRKEGRKENDLRVRI
jgi:hypothetical protein